MKHNPAIATLVTILMVTACLLTPLGRASAGATAVGTKPVLEDLDLRSPTGEQVSLAPFIGSKAVVLVFWATWCPICKKEVPDLNRLNANPLVKVIGINEGERPGRIRDFIVSNRIGYQVVVDRQESLAKFFGVPGIPFCVIIGKSGVIAYRGSGLPENFDSYLKQ